MSVLIRDMEMPKNCNECRLAYRGACIANIGREVKVDQICPLVEIPPHGRLIDADALCERLEKAMEIKPYLEGAFNAAISFALIAPTIIPAEPPKEEN